MTHPSRHILIPSVATWLLSQNSTLVLTAEHRDRNAHEPSGEPETLWGRMQVGRWGGLDQQLWDVVQLCEDAGWG